MRGGSWGLAWGAVLLAMLLVAPPGSSVTGSGSMTSRLPVQLWGPVDAQAPAGGLVARGGAFDGGLELAQGRVLLTTLTYDPGLLGGVRSATETLAGSGAVLQFLPRDAAQLAAWGDASLSAPGKAQLALPQGDAFRVEQGSQGLVVPFAPRSLAVATDAGEGRLEGKLHLLLTDAAVRVLRGPSGLLDLDLAPQELLQADALPASPLPRGAALPALPLGAVRDAAQALDALPLPQHGVLVKRILEVQGEGVLTLRSHGASLLAFGRAPLVHVLGAAAFPGALGDLALGGHVVSLRGDSAQAAGDFWLRTAAGDGDARTMTMSGTFDTFAVNGATLDLAPGSPGAALLAGAAVLGLASPLLRPLGSRLLGAFYARIPTSDVLGSDVRRGLYAAVQAEPGLSLSDLAARTGLSWGNAVHHLNTLKRAGFVVSLRHGRHRRWFVTGTADQGERAQVAQLRNPTSAAVAKRILEEPGLSQKQLADRLAMTPQAVHWHLRRLAEAGLVERVRVGREVKHYVRAAPPLVAEPAKAPPPLGAAAVAR